MAASFTEGLVEAFAGAQGGLAALCVCMPLENINKKQAASPDRTSVLQIISSVHQRGGVAAFWRSFVPTACVVVGEKFWMFLCYSILKAIYARTLRVPVATIGPLPNLLIGYIAEILRLPMTYPVELACVASMTATNGDGAITIASRVVRENGVIGLYR
jgi:hypothetical protein